MGKRGWTVFVRNPSTEGTLQVEADRHQTVGEVAKSVGLVFGRRPYAPSFKNLETKEVWWRDDPITAIPYGESVDYVDVGTSV